MDEPCQPSSLAARVMAGHDAIFGTDNSAAVEHGGNLSDSLHYAAFKTELALERPVYGPVEVEGKLASPYRKYFNTGNEKVNKFLDNATHLALGNHPDLSTRPSEVLGDDVVRPLEDAYRKYSEMLTGAKENGIFDNHLKEIENRNFDNPELREKLMEIREESGYQDALDEAQERIEDKFGDGQDDDRYKYGRFWAEAQRRATGEASWPEELIAEGSRNFTENQILNNLVSAGRNYFDRWRAAYQFGIDNYALGEKQYRAAVKSGSSELHEAGIIGSRFTDSKKPDLFNLPEQANKGITYYAAKQHALNAGKSATEAKLYAKKAVEQLQFQQSFVNRPRAQWSDQGRTNTALLTFALHERRWYRSLWKGAFSDNPDIAKQSRRALLYYGVGNGIINGLNSVIPEELGQAWEHFAPESYRKWREGVGTVSLARLLNLSMDEISRPSLTGAGLLLKIPTVFQGMDRVKDDIGGLLAHPDNPKKWLKVAMHGSMLLPSGMGVPFLSNVGNKMTWAFTEYVYRSIVGDYTRYTRKHKKYTTDNAEEFWNAVRGGREGFDRELKKDELDAMPSKRRAAR